MLKTPLSTVIGGVGFYTNTKNTLVIGGHKPKPEPPFDILDIFKNGEQGFWLDPTLNIKDNWRVNFVESTTNPRLWLVETQASYELIDDAYKITLLEEKASGIGLGSSSKYPVGSRIEANKTVYRSVEVKKVDAKYLRFGAAADGSTVFIDLDTLEVLRNAGNIQCLIERLSDDFIRISTFVYHSASPSATHASNLLGWGNVRLAASLSDTLGTSLIVRKPVFALLDGYDLDTPKYQEIITSDAAFLEAHPNHMLFQDATATVPVLSKAQPVGLMLDKSKRLAIDVEKVRYTNVNMLTGVSIIDDTFVFNNVAFNSGFFISNSVQTGRMYKVSLVVDELIGNLQLMLGRGAGSQVFNISESGTYNLILFSLGSVPEIRINAGSLGASCVISNFSVKQIAGNHAKQLTSTARPLLQNNIKFDGIDDALNIAFPSALTNCTIFTVKHGEQAQILDAQSVAQNHIINQDFKYS